MKLLLTSSGVSNRVIAQALLELHQKKPSEIKVGFIPLAANVEAGNKDWVVNQLLTLWRYGYNWVDIIDPSAAGIDWKKRLAEVDVLYLTGGNTFHLLDQAKKTGFDVWLKKILETKVYVGGSASSILLTPSISIAGVGDADENTPGIQDLAGLGVVDFEIAPHAPNYFSYDTVATYAKTTKNTLYALDDHCAIKVQGPKCEVIGTGQWRIYNEPENQKS